MSTALLDMTEFVPLKFVHEICKLLIDLSEFITKLADAYSLGEALIEILSDKYDDGIEELGNILLSETAGTTYTLVVENALYTSKQKTNNVNVMMRNVFEVINLSPSYKIITIRSYLKSFAALKVIHMNAK